MSIERQRQSGQRYVDVATGRTIDAFYPADPRNLRSCLALKYKIISTEHFDIAIDVSEPIASTKTPISDFTHCPTDRRSRIRSILKDYSSIFRMSPGQALVPY